MDVSCIDVLWLDGVKHKNRPNLYVLANLGYIFRTLADYSTFVCPFGCINRVVIVLCS
jgi:hypothetical protein